jgi:hypothetical protein
VFRGRFVGLVVVVVVTLPYSRSQQTLGGMYVQHGEQNCGTIRIHIRREWKQRRESLGQQALGEKGEKECDRAYTGTPSRDVMMCLCVVNTMVCGVLQHH